MEFDSMNKNGNGNPNWIELPEDMWFLILSKVKTIDIIKNVDKVCIFFRNLCNQPFMFRTIKMDLPKALRHGTDFMTRYAVDRSAGQLVDIYLEYVCDDATLLYVAQRSPNLRCLRLNHCFNVTDDGLIRAVQKLPMLEEVQITICSFSEDAVVDLGHTLPRLSSFSLGQVGSSRRHFIGDPNEEALAIGQSMPHLRRLQLIGNYMTNEGLRVILDGCPLLESLDLRACFHIDLFGELGQRCNAIKHLRLPYDSTEDYGFQAYSEEEGSDDECKIDNFVVIDD